MAHLLSYSEEKAIGPLQRDEAVALFGIVRTLCPATVVEFGFYQGQSAFNFLAALDSDAKLFSYDISKDAAECAKQEFVTDSRFVFLGKSQALFEHADVHNRPIDLVFFDASHELSLNIATFSKILPCLAPSAVVVIHDTGLWAKACFGPFQTEIANKTPSGWVSESSYAHQPDERLFVNWILNEHQDFGALHLHSSRKLRHGFTMIQQQTSLKA